MNKPNILYIGGSINQTKMMHKISMQLPFGNNYFSTFYGDGLIRFCAEHKLLDFTILGGAFKRASEQYLIENNLKIDYRGQNRNYDLVFTCTDLIVPKNIKNKNIILVQEGMTDPEDIMYYLVKYLKLPRYLASTSTTGLSDRYKYFCVASEGYKKLFIKKGVKAEKIIVTGIPNFDNVKENNNNDFIYKDYALVATSDTRETFKYENRKKFILECKKIAGDKEIIFKLHPNEKHDRAEKEIKSLIPDAIIFKNGNIDNMIANCSVLITKYSSVVYIGLALNKKVYSYFNIEMLKQLTPIQNNGNSAKNISRIAKLILHQSDEINESKNLNLILSEY
ncbi:MAG: CDP-glycerol glycerophosphotransferase family protein [bacterium]